MVLSVVGTYQIDAAISTRSNRSTTASVPWSVGKRDRQQ